MTPDLPKELRYLEGTDNRLLDMVVVIPVARCEWHLACKLLFWMDSLKDSPELIIYCAPAVTVAERTSLVVITACTVVHAEFDDPGYFGGANKMFKGALDYVEAKYPGKAMLWLEADCVPMRSGWFAAILDEYRGCGQPFGGDVHLCELNHMTGNGCWHPNWRKIAPSLAALPGPDPEWGWDSQNSEDTFTRCHRMKTIQQIWRPELPITEKWVTERIRPETALFHQCKDGSLIDVLCDRAGIARIPLPAQLEQSTYAKGRANPFGLEYAAKLSRGARMVAGFHTPPPVPTTEVLYVTFARDMDFLKYSLRSYQKFCTGFAGVTVAVPESERGLYNWVTNAKVVYFKETPGKGMLHQMLIKCRADEICPHVDCVLHLDADTLFWRKCTPADFFYNGLPILVRERYAELRNPNRLNWQKAVQDAIGLKPEYETMVRQGAVHWKETYARLREKVELYVGMPFDNYVLSCRNEWPQSWAEYPALGAIAIAHFRGRYEMRDYDWKQDAIKAGLPDGTQFQYLYFRDRDPIAETWSHGGIDQYKSDIEAWLNGRAPTYWLK